MRRAVSGWVIGVAIFLGFMYAAVGTGAVPSSASWTGGIVCSSPYHLQHTSSETSVGANEGQDITGFECVNGASAHSASTPAIFGLQFLLGSIVLLVIATLVGVVLRVAKPSTA